MSYQQRTLKVVSAHKSVSKRLITVLLSALPVLSVLGATSLLSSCGFHLRGYEAPLAFDVEKTAIVLEDNRISFPLKLPLTRQLQALGADVVDGMNIIENRANSTANNTAAEQIATIEVANVRFRRYELVGVLTEIRLVLSADVTYKTYQNGQPITLTNPIQVERSYQYNEASVSTDDQQGDQIRDWLYGSLARRITDQYVAISLPKVPPNSVSRANNATTLILDSKSIGTASVATTETVVSPAVD